MDVSWSSHIWEVSKILKHQGKNQARPGMGESRWGHLWMDNRELCPSKMDVQGGKNMSRHKGNAAEKDGAFNWKQSAQGNVLAEGCVRPWKIPLEALESHGEHWREMKGTCSGIQDSQEQGGGRECGHFQAQQPLVASTWEQSSCLSSFITILGWKDQTLSPLG